FLDNRVVDRISELEPIEIAVRGEPESFPIVHWPALMPSPAALGHVALLLPRSAPVAEQILPEFETQVLESLSRELGISSKADKPESPWRTSAKAQGTQPAPAPGRKHRKLTGANAGILLSLSPTSAAALLALLASLSAMLSAYASPTIIRVPYFNAPLLPAVYFGLVLCAGVCLWNSKSKLHLIAVFVATIIGWTGAWEGAITVFLSTSGASCPSCPLTTEMTEITRKAASGVVGGFIGSLSILLSKYSLAGTFVTGQFWRGYLEL